MMPHHISRQREPMTPYDSRSKPEPMTQQGHKREPMIPSDSRSKREAMTQQGHKPKRDHPVVSHRPNEIQERGPPVVRGLGRLFAQYRPYSERHRIMLLFPRILAADGRLLGDRRAIAGR